MFKNIKPSIRIEEIFKEMIRKNGHDKSGPKPSDHILAMQRYLDEVWAQRECLCERDPMKCPVHLEIKEKVREFRRIEKRREKERKEFFGE